MKQTKTIKIFIFLLFLIISVKPINSGETDIINKEFKKQYLNEQLIKSLNYYPLGFPLKNNDYLYISSYYGKRYHPIFKKRKFHYGVDIVGFYRAPIIATASGIVTTAKYMDGYGKIVIIKHRFGYETRYAHLRTIFVKKDQNIKKGDTLGIMGNTGRSAGIHLHYEIREMGYPLNPLDFFKIPNVYLFAKKK